MPDLPSFAKQAPEQPPLDLSAIPAGEEKTAVLEAAYDGGYHGCFLPDDGGFAGRLAAWHADEFRDNAGRNQYLFGDVADVLCTDETDGMHVNSTDAFETRARDRQIPADQDWLFATQQNSGICVNASGVELQHGLLGYRAARPAYRERFLHLAAYYAYAFRGYCGAGWYTSAHASVSLEYGWCPAMQIEAAGNRLDFDAENDSERLVTSTWCRSGPPAWLREWTKANWTFEPGAISEFQGGIPELKTLFAAGGQLHHGSNYTSGASTPNSLTRIGGHAQTAFGADWSDKTLKFFADQGIKYTSENFPVVNHQTWGPGWRGEVAARYWPAWWGPKPEGAWICSAQQILEYFSRSAYCYLPRLRGVPAVDTPPTPPPGPAAHPNLHGVLRTDTFAPIRGKLSLEQGGVTYEWIIAPDDVQAKTYKPVAKIL